ncbi:uncharacterized protein C20orf96 homolog isoform X2 [Choloepus didactylus]|uniref:uncharacterized protein C20orf96 homolog isoform X2 n=1 Tax=Choloepus didactylus TaxID=27675 RepID=UPI0018A09B63|nr:uncharacterized protein C20orf96 homolog isoform X2 [Choloepus didactylus]
MMLKFFPASASFQTRPPWDSLHSPQTRVSGLYSKSVMTLAGQVRSQREPHRKKLDPGKMQADMQLMKMMLRHRRTSLQELRRHEDFLIKLNQDLVKTIQEMEDSTALKVRKMLQEQSILGTVMDILEYSNKKRLQDLTRELQEWEEKEENKISNLKQQGEQLNAKIKKIQEEVNFLSTYMDHEYPVRSVQIANLERQLQQMKDRQQDELDDLNEMRKMILAYLSNKIERKKINLLKSLVVKAQQPHQEALLQKIRDNQDLVKCIDKFRAFIDQFQEEIPTLKAEVEELQAQLKKPREIIFQDVLLRRPKCTPDMDVILNIPVEELLPF